MVEATRDLREHVGRDSLEAPDLGAARAMTDDHSS
jgi:hypothetical protein